MFYNFQKVKSAYKAYFLYFYLVILSTKLLTGVTKSLKKHTN